MYSPPQSQRMKSDSNTPNIIEENLRSRPSSWRYLDVDTLKAQSELEERQDILTDSGSDRESIRISPRPHWEGSTKREFTTSSPASCSIAAENGGLHVQGYKEDSSNLHTCSFVRQQLKKLITAFGDWNNQPTLKHIRASSYVLRTYHDSFLFGVVPLSLQARSRLRAGVIGMAWHVLEFTLALLSGVLYVYSTYRREAQNNWVSQIQNAISVIFLADYTLRVYCEPVRLYYVISFWGIVDFLSVVPVILIFRSVSNGDSIIRLLQFVRILRLFAFTYRVGLVGSSVMQQIILLTVATFGVSVTAKSRGTIRILKIVEEADQGGRDDSLENFLELNALLLDAGILHWVEYDAAPKARKDMCPEQGCITFWQALYFLIVTVSTVGYGDVIPKTVLGQFVTIVTIVAALTILPIQIGQITSLAYRRPYGGSYSARKSVGSRFLIISGSISVQSVQSFLAEFYSPARSEDLDAYPLRIVILAPFTPSFELKQVLCLYDDLVEFIEGSPVRQSDLERVSADKAMAFFLLADRDAANPQLEDSAQLVRALAVHRFCRGQRHRRDMRILLEVLDPETQTSAVWDESHAGGIEVICPVKVHYKMMARSCFVRGLYTLITNLFTSEIQLKHTKHDFLTEYFHSFDNEVYPVILPPAFHDIPFEDVAEVLHSTFNSTLFAVDTLVLCKGRAVRKVLLNAAGYRIKPDDVGIVIARDLHTAYAISMYERNDQDDKYQLLRNLCDRERNHSNITRNTEGMDVGTRSGRWTRDRDTLFLSNNPVIKIESASLRVSSPNVFPKGASFKLERDFRSVIRRVFSLKDTWVSEVHQLGAEEIGILQGRDIEMPELEDDTESHTYLGSPHIRFPDGISLERATEDLLAWPPVDLNQRPHPAVLDRRADTIMKNLEERTLSMVTFNTPHILVCCQVGWPAHFFYFLLELRKPGFPNPPVVILYPKVPTAKQWGTVGVFKGVFYLKGSPVYELDLMRGGVLQAGNIVVLADQGIPVDFGGSSFEDNKFVRRAPSAYTSDVENIVVAANVRRLYGRKSMEFMIVEMQHAETFYYLEPQHEISHAYFSREDLKRNRDILNHFVLPFMEGKAISSSMLGFLLRSSFYNRNTVPIVEQLVQGGGSYNVKADPKTGDGEIHEHDDADDVDDGRLKLLTQIAVPDQYAGRPYSDLFRGLLRQQRVIALGLFRVKGTLGAPSRYVLTNPKSTCIVNPDDLVYVIT